MIEDLVSGSYRENDMIDRLARALMMLNGDAKWDGELIAELVRDESNSSYLFKHGLADLIEGKRHPLKLTMSGGGKSTPTFEGAQLYSRNMKIGSQAQALIDGGESWEAATIDVAEVYNLHENTVRLALDMYRISRSYSDEQS